MFGGISVRPCDTVKYYTHVQYLPPGGLKHGGLKLVSLDVVHVLYTLLLFFQGHAPPATSTALITRGQQALILELLICSSWEHTVTTCVLLLICIFMFTRVR